MKGLKITKLTYSLKIRNCKLKIKQKYQIPKQKVDQEIVTSNQ